MRHILTGIAVFCLALLVGISIAPAQAVRTTADLPLSEVRNREIIVELDTSRGAKSVSAFCAANDLELQRTRPLSYATYQVVRVPDGEDYYAALARLSADPQVKTVGPNVKKHVSETVLNDPLLLNTASTVEEGLTAPHATNDQWALLETGCLDAWDITTGDKRVIVALLDTGVNFDHEDLQGRFWINTDEIADNSIDDDGNGYVDDYRGYDFHNIANSGDDSDPTDPSSDTISHGNATASIIAAIGNNGKGIAGVAGGKTAAGGIRLMILRVGTNTDIGVDAEIAAIDYAINNGAKIISMSFGGESGGPPEENAIDRAWNAGLIIVAASGNVGQGNKNGNDWLIDLPAGFDNCIAVGATTIFPPNQQTISGSTPVVGEALANYSKTGPETELVAPGTHILCAAHDDHAYSNLAHQFTGTSAATPLVAGYAALIWSGDIVTNGHFTMSNQDVRTKMQTDALDLGQPGRDEEYGYGRIQMALPPPPPIIYGDANDDGVVDDADLPVILALNGVKSSDTKYNEAADYNTDGTINNADVLAVVSLIGGDPNGDTNEDGTVDENDMQVLIDRFGAKAGEANYKVAADANRDGIVDELDLFVVGRQFGS